MNIYETFEKPLIKILAHMEINGIKLDKKFLNKLSENFQKKISNLERKIYNITKKEFKIGSTKQLGEVLYNDLKISALKKTKKGSFATGASVLEDLAYKVMNYQTSFRMETAHKIKKYLFRFIARTS